MKNPSPPPPVPPLWLPPPEIISAATTTSQVMPIPTARTDHDRGQRTRQDDAPEYIGLARSHRSRCLKIAHVDRARAADYIDDDV